MSPQPDMDPHNRMVGLFLGKSSLSSVPITSILWPSGQLWSSHIRKGGDSIWTGGRPLHS
jgi:hypothetical protein